jgi:hypothetical protein
LFGGFGFFVSGEVIEQAEAKHVDERDHGKVAFEGTAGIERVGVRTDGSRHRINPGNE